MAENKDIIKLSSLIVDNQPINETNFVPDTVELINEVSNYKPIKISDFKKTIIVVDEIQENGNYQPETCQNAYDPNKVSMYVDQQKNETLMSNYYTIEEIEEILSGKTNVDSVYTKDETYNKNEVYNLEEIDFLLKLKANKVDVYSKIDMNTLLDLKANKNEVYDKNEIDEILGGYYTKLDIDTILENKADIEDVIAISGQVLTNIEDISDLQTDKQDKLIAGDNIVISDNVISTDLNDYLKTEDAATIYETVANVQILSNTVSENAEAIEDLEENKADKASTLSGYGITDGVTESTMTSHVESNLHLTEGQRTKLEGIEAGAEVNVNADWNATTGDAQILNKPNTLSGYGITDAYTQTEIDTKLNNTRTDKILDTVVSTWSASTTYSDYKYEAIVYITNLKESDSVEVIYNIIDAVSTNHAPGFELYEGYIKLFAKVDTAITIPTLVVTKIDL